MKMSQYCYGFYATCTSKYMYMYSIVFSLYTIIVVTSANFIFSVTVCRLESSVVHL